MTGLVLPLSRFGDSSLPGSQPPAPGIRWANHDANEMGNQLWSTLNFDLQATNWKRRTKELDANTFEPQKYLPWESGSPKIIHFIPSIFLISYMSASSSQFKMASHMAILLGYHSAPLHLCMATNSASLGARCTPRPPRISQSPSPWKREIVWFKKMTQKNWPFQWKTQS